MSIVTTGRNILIDRYNYGANGIKEQPVDRDVLKNHLQVTHSYDDNVIFEIGGYVPAATDEAENIGNVSLIRQKRRQYVGEEVLDALSGQTIHLSFGPILAVTGVFYLDENEDEQEFEDFRATSDGIYFKKQPSLAYGPDTVWIDYEAGFGNSPSEVPAAWQNIVMQIACHKYEFRGGESTAMANDAWLRMLNQLALMAGGTRRQ